jgi:hypothetical protein
MGFVKVRHADGREADITAGEVAFYRSMGFGPVGGSAIETAAPGGAASTATDPPPSAITGTDMRLDAIHAELRAIRDLLTPAAANSPADGGTVELRGAGTSVAATTTPAPTTSSTTTPPPTTTSAPTTATTTTTPEPRRRGE